MTAVLSVLKRFNRTLSGTPGSRPDSAEQTRVRIVWTMIGIATLFGIALARLTVLGFEENRTALIGERVDIELVAARPEITDRNGETLALDIPVLSLYAEPRLIENPDETFESLITVLPDLDFETSMRKLKSGRGFEWLKREITPIEQQDILALGLPGIGFREEKKRYYPGGRAVSHVLGHTNVDNQGIAGLEKHLDDTGLRALHAAGFAVKRDLERVETALDLRVQHILRDELEQAMERYRAIAAAGVILDVHTGEIVALSSLPDYDPNNPGKHELNLITAGVFEMGSTFKAFTTAMALDSGKVTLASRFDASKPLRFGRFAINDYRGKKRVLSVPEVFIYSSNIGTAKMADVIGADGHKKFLKRLGLLDRIEGLELVEVARPVVPSRWAAISSATISFGHGMSTTPLQTAVAAAALVNGGKLIPPTLLRRDRATAAELAKQVLKPKTSDEMRYLFRLNVLDGSGKRAEVPGYLVGGKTGTADKVVNGRYSRDKRFNAFLSAFPMNDPRYVVLVAIDEPKPEPGKVFATAGLNTVPTVGRVVERAAPLLGVKPDFRVRDTAQLSSYRP